MLTKHPKVFSHNSVLQLGNYITPNYILSSNSLFNRYCPHRMYPIGEIGDILTQSITCKLHGLEWDLQGKPINNNKPMACKNFTIGKSGLIYSNFVEPNHQWVYDLANENNLRYSHCYDGQSKASWLWMMEIQTDLLHIRQGSNVVHPELSSITDLNDIKLDSGEGWALQTCSTGWWLCIFPYTFIEYSKGCLAINYTVPNDIKNEFGFTWMSQFYYDPIVTTDKRKEFEKYFQDVFLEDVNAIEKQIVPWYPIYEKISKLESHNIQFSEWVVANKSS